MIQDVANFFEKQISGSTEVRNFSYDMFVHRIRLKNSTVQNIMATDVDEICKKINKQTGAKVLDPKLEPIKRLIQKRFSGKINEGLANFWIKKVYNEWGGRDLERGANHKSFKRGKNYAISGSSTQLTITLAKGLVNVSNTYKDKEGSYNAILAVFRRLYGQLLQDIRKEIIAQATKRAKEEGVTAETGGTSEVTSEYMLIRGHGVSSEGGARPDKRQGQQTTTGIMDPINKLDKLLKGEVDLLKSGDGENTIGGKLLKESIDQVVEAYKEALETNFDLRKFYNPDTVEWNEDLIIEMEIISKAPDVKGQMQQRAMDPFDYSEIAKALKKEAEKIINKKLPFWARMWWKMRGSPTREELFRQKGINNVIDALERVNVRKGKKGKGGVDLRLKVNKKLKKRLPKSSKARAGFTIGKLKQSIQRDAGKAVKSPKAGRPARGQGKTAASPIALRNILNEYLPEMVAANMGSPALNFQTGRFANSARVENVNIGPRGGLNIDYTYMRNPYETFEPGGKQGSTRRDPKRLIGKSIRELSVSILGRQPTTLRRT